MQEESTVEDNDKGTKNPEYTVSDEPIESVIVGLEPKRHQTILAIGGAGDQAFALLEYAGKVIAVDYQSEQIEHLLREVDLLTKGAYDKFLDFKPGSQNISFGQRDFKSSIERRKRYFTPARLRVISDKLGNLSIVQTDILEQVALQQFDALYLSNALGHILDMRSKKTGGGAYRETPEVLSQLTINLRPRGLVFVSDHEELSSLYRFWGGLPKAANYALKSDILPSELMLDERLTLLARHLDMGIWSPAVYRKK